MYTLRGLLIVVSSAFTNNEAKKVGGVLRSQDESVSIDNSSFSSNTAESHGGIMFTVQCSTHIARSTFHYNTGSLYTFNGNLTFSGQSKFEYGVELTSKIAVK